jgi:hypothetical protein
MDFIALSGMQRLPFHGVDYSVSVWIKTSKGGTIFSRSPESKSLWSSSLPGGKSLFVQKDGCVWFSVAKSGQLCACTTKVADGLWHHIALVHTSGAATYALFVDGVQGASKEIEQKDPDPVDYQLKLAYTNSDFPQPSYFDGLLSDLVYWNTALSARKIKNDAGSVPGGKKLCVCQDTDCRQLDPRLKVEVDHFTRQKQPEELQSGFKCKPIMGHHHHKKHKKN